MLLSHSQALKLAAALRRTPHGLVRIKIQSGAVQIEVKPDGAHWTVTWRDEPERVQ